MSNGADAEFVFGEDCRIERNLVPISKGPSCFETHRLHAATAIKSFELCFGRDVKTIRQTHFDLLGEKIIGRSVAESLALKKFAEEECPWRQHIGIYYVGETAARKLGWRAVCAGHFLVREEDWSLASDDDRLLCCCLSEGRMIIGSQYETRACDQWNEPVPPTFKKKGDFSHRFRA